MYDHLILFCAGLIGTLALVIGYAAWSFCAAAGRADDADEFAAQRTPGMGDLSTVTETHDFTGDAA